MLPSVPWLGPVPTAKVKASPLGALPVSVMTLAVFCCTVTDWPFAVGDADTVMLTVAGLLVRLVVVSVTVKVKESGPV